MGREPRHRILNRNSEKYCKDCAEIMQRSPHRRGYAAIARGFCNSKRAQRLCRGHAAPHNLSVLQRSCRDRAAIAQSKFRMAFTPSQRLFYSEKYCRDCAEIMQRFPHRRGYAAIARRLCNSKRAQRLCRGHAALHNLGVLQRSCRGRAAIAQSKFRMAFTPSQRLF